MNVTSTICFRTLALLSALAAGAAPALAAPAAQTNAPHSSQAMPAALRPVFYHALAKDAGTAWRINKAGCAVLPKQSLKACFDRGGTHFSGAAPLSLHLVAWGRGDKLAGVAAVAPKINGNEASYRHGTLTEWWRVLPVGFEQGFTIAKRPAGHGQLTLALRSDTTSPLKGEGWGEGEQALPIAARWTPHPHLLPQGEKGQDTLAWGKLRYGKLVVTDANGKVVPATIGIASKLAPTGGHAKAGGRILISVNDARAVYPLTVDPLVWIEQKVTASDGAKKDYFGTSVALDGATALIAAPYAIVGGQHEQGAVYVFTQTNGSWNETQKLIASDGGSDNYFGSSVALDGATALVGAPYTNAGQGAAYVFRQTKGTWSQKQKLTASDGTSNAEFGNAIALDSTTALIGAKDATIGGNGGQGAIYVFTESGSTWSQKQKLTASDGAALDEFGVSVALDGTTALIGAWNATVGGNSLQGAAYVFSESGGTWSQAQKLTASDGGLGDQFGNAVTLDGTTALIGAKFATVNGNFEQGAAYVFAESGSTWTQTQKLTASDGEGPDAFGSSVALVGPTALVGAETATINANVYQGAAYVFTRSSGSWSQTQKLISSDGAAGDLFGRSIALAGTTALIGASQVSSSGQGVAYFEGGSDLGLTLSAPKKTTQGQTYVSQTIATDNSKTDSAAITVKLPVPKGADFVSANATQGSCSQTKGVVTCDFGAIDGNAGTATANIKLKASGKVGDTIKNTASVLHATPALDAGADTKIVTPNQPPVASDGTLTTDENKAASGTLKATDPDGDALTFSIVDKPTHGTVSLDDASTGAYTYTPAKDYSGADSFTFKANDGTTDSNTATISITVNTVTPPPPPPPPPPPKDNGGGSLGALGLLALALLGLGACLLRRRHAH